MVKDVDPIEESSRDSGRGPERADPELMEPEPATERLVSAYKSWKNFSA